MIDFIRIQQTKVIQTPQNNGGYSVFGNSVVNNPVGILDRSGYMARQEQIIPDQKIFVLNPKFSLF